MLVPYRSVISSIANSSSIYLPFCKKGCFLWAVGACTLLWDLWDWGERNNKVFGGGRWTLVLFRSLGDFSLMELLWAWFFLRVRTPLRNKKEKRG